MTAEIVEGETRDLPPDEPRALTVVEAPEYRLSVAASPEAMVTMATRMATVLRDVVERQRLYAVIQGKKFPQVEAWMTIARMDNVVARESEPPVRHDDGSYEAFVELVRLSDGMVIGRASALCGTPDDAPWGGTPAKYGKPEQPPRSEPARRSMAVTRATSRAFRQQYSWIMALAGYEPTPAEEMDRDTIERERPASPTRPRDGEPAIGVAEIGKSPADYELRQGPDGYGLSFRLTEGRKGIKVVALGPLAEALSLVKDAVIGQRVSCWGSVAEESYTANKGKENERTVTYPVLTLERIQAPELTLPAVPAIAPGQVPAFDDAEAAAIAAAVDAAPAGVA